ncbi:PP2C family serine/threonine-protein phosphatase [Rhodovulum sp. ES.010]|uniref:PP2C family protein-serine/threonine phosphatase n=1 Tax=Rhodovulum sp. ES.010 TaxID=1882821 RepID=UPI00158823C6|nr:protein phosphatase 2C domain-containing protein [Rhodovulum sp. ES.010]
MTGAELRLDVATGIGQGRREHQEDAIVADFPIGGDIGIAVLADGMGGHAAGDVASRIAVTEVFGALKLHAADADDFLREAPDHLQTAAERANASLAEHMRRNAETGGMGTTLVALAVARARLFWLSIGDSPLFLFRDGDLRRINQDHSLAPQIDGMARMGLLSDAEAREHPDRNCLTSAITGADISRIDCPADPVRLEPGDIVLAASDGLTFIDRDRIGALLAQHRRRSSAEIAGALFSEIEALADPDQDNVCFTVIRVTRRGFLPAGLSRRPAHRGTRPEAPPARAARRGRRWPLPLAARLLPSFRRRTP